jgi:ethanolamine permease
MALVIALIALVALFINPAFRPGVIGVGVWFLAGLGYFAFYARKHIVHSPEEAFAVAQSAQHSDQPSPPSL